MLQSLQPNRLFDGQTMMQHQHTHHCVVNVDYGKMSFTYHQLANKQSISRNAAEVVNFTYFEIKLLKQVMLRFYLILRYIQT